VACPIAAERHAGTLAAEAPRGLADEEDARTRATIRRGEHAPPPGHRRADLAGGGIRAERREGRLGGAHIDPL